MSNNPNRPSERIRRSVIVPIQMGGSFLISLTSPLVTLASKVIARKPRHDAPQQEPDVAKPVQPMESKLSKSEKPGPGQPR